MSKSTLVLANGKRIATEQFTHDSLPAHAEHVIATPVGATPLPSTAYLVDGDDSVEMGVDGSSTAKEFTFTPADPDIYRIGRISLVMSLAALPSAVKFGNLSALTNGLLLQIVDADDNEIVDLLGGQPLKSNLDLMTLFEVELISWDSVYALRAQWKLAQPIRLEGGLGEYLLCTVQDNLSSISRMRVLVEAALETELT